MANTSRPSCTRARPPAWARRDASVAVRILVGAVVAVRHAVLVPVTVTTAVAVVVAKRFFDGGQRRPDARDTRQRNTRLTMPSSANRINGIEWRWGIKAAPRKKSPYGAPNPIQPVGQRRRPKLRLRYGCTLNHMLSLSMPREKGLSTNCFSRCARSSPPPLLSSNGRPLRLVHGCPRTCPRMAGMRSWRFSPEMLRFDGLDTRSRHGHVRKTRRWYAPS